MSGLIGADTRQLESIGELIRAGFHIAGIDTDAKTVRMSRKSSVGQVDAKVTEDGRVYGEHIYNFLRQFGGL